MSMEIRKNLNCYIKNILDKIDEILIIELDIGYRLIMESVMNSYSIST
jgi:hypothetical protein